MIKNTVWSVLYIQSLFTLIVNQIITVASRSTQQWKINSTNEVIIYYPVSIWNNPLGTYRGKRCISFKKYAKHLTRFCRSFPDLWRVFPSRSRDVFPVHREIPPFCKPPNCKNKTMKPRFKVKVGVYKEEASGTRQSMIKNKMRMTHLTKARLY